MADVWLHWFPSLAIQRKLVSITLFSTLVSTMDSAHVSVLMREVRSLHLSTAWSLFLSNLDAKWNWFEHKLFGICGWGVILKNSKQLNYVIVRSVWSFLGKEAEQKMSIVFSGFLLCADYNMYISSFNFHKALWHTYNHYEHHHPYVTDIDTLRLK